MSFKKIKILFLKILILLLKNFDNFIRTPVKSEMPRKQIALYISCYFETILSHMQIEILFHLHTEILYVCELLCC